jgi:hypothetical protein
MANCGSPLRLQTKAAARTSKGRDKIREEVSATIVGHWQGTERVLLRRDDNGETFEALAPTDIDPYVETGLRVVVYMRGEQRLGWYLPDKKIGVREDRPD